jgi:large subunit ribosomal protein L6
MSRVGKKPILIPENVKVSIDDHKITVEGPKGKITETIHKDMKVEIVNNQIIVSRPSDEKKFKALHGTTRAIIANMVEGVIKEFTKVLQIEGVGYKAKVEGRKLILEVGFTHSVIMDIPEGISVVIEKENLIKVSGVNKQLVGEFAAKIRAVKPPDPYKGKGIKYLDEKIRRKAGKVAVTTGKK